MNGGALSEGVEALGEDGVNSSLTDADKLSDVSTCKECSACHVDLYMNLGKWGLINV